MNNPQLKDVFVKRGAKVIKRLEILVFVASFCHQKKVKFQQKKYFFSNPFMRSETFFSSEFAACQ